MRTGSRARPPGRRWWTPWCTTSTDGSSTPAPTSCSTPEESPVPVLAVALPGHMEAGKTTLTAGLVRAGLGYLTDEALAFDRETLLVLPIPEAVVDRPRSLAALPRTGARRSRAKRDTTASNGRCRPRRSGPGRWPIMSRGGRGVPPLRGRRRHHAGARRSGGGAGRAGQEHLPLQGAGRSRAGPPGRSGPERRVLPADHGRAGRGGRPRGRSARRCARLRAGPA